MDLKNVNDNCVDCMVSFLPDNPDIEVFRECCRVLKPGAFAFFVSAPRQDVSARMILKLENAGFYIKFSAINWCYGTGMPNGLEKATRMQLNVTEPVTEIAKKLDGAFAGHQPNPGYKFIFVVMKPLTEKTFIDQAMKTMKGITWLDDCRIPLVGSDFIKFGRFPANLLVSNDALNDGKIYQSSDYGDVGSFSKYFDLDAWYKAKFKTDDAPEEDKLREYFKTMGSREGDVVLDPFNDAYNDEAVIKQLEADHANQLKLETKDLDGWL